MSVEKDIQNRLTNWLDTNYPDVLYRVDLAGLYIPDKVRAKQTADLQKSTGWPDLFIAYPNKSFHGLFLEVKEGIDKVITKDGKFINDHVKNQHNVLKQLRKYGYAAEFALGLQNGLDILNWYFSLDNLYNRPYNVEWLIKAEKGE